MTHKQRNLVEFCFNLTDEQKVAILGSPDSMKVLRMLLARLAEHLTTREYYIVIARTRGASTKEICADQAMCRSAVREAEKSAHRKIKRPWLLQVLRKQLHLPAIAVGETDFAEDWFQISPALKSAMAPRTLGHIATMPEFWREHRLAQHVELEFHRLQSNARKLLGFDVS